MFVSKLFIDALVVCIFAPVRVASCRMKLHVRCDAMRKIGKWALALTGCLRWQLTLSPCCTHFKIFFQLDAGRGFFFFWGGAPLWRRHFCYSSSGVLAPGSPSEPHWPLLIIVSQHLKLNFYLGFDLWAMNVEFKPSRYRSLACD